MQATVKLSGVILRKLEVLARSEGLTTADLIARIVEAYVTSGQVNDESRLAAFLPLIPASETGLIKAISGSDLDDLFSREHFSA